LKLPLDPRLLLELVDRAALERLSVHLASEAGGRLSFQVKAQGGALRQGAADAVLADDTSLQVQGVALDTDPRKALAGASLLFERAGVRIPASFLTRAQEVAAELLPAPFRGLRLAFSDLQVGFSGPLPLGELAARLPAGKSKPLPVEARQLVGVVDQIALEGLLVVVSCDGPALNADLQFREFALRAGRPDGLAVDEARLRVEGLVPGPDPKAALAKARVRLEKMRLRLTGELLNNVARAFADRLPPQVKNLRFSFSGDLMTISGEIKVGLSIPFSVDVGFSAVDNRLLVSWQGFWGAGFVPLPGFARKTLLGLVRSKIEAAARGLAEVQDEGVLINPWPRLPVAVETRVKRFAVEGQQIVLELATPAEPTPSAGVPAPPAQRQVEPRASSSAPAAVTGAAAASASPPGPAPSGQEPPLQGRESPPGAPAAPVATTLSPPAEAPSSGE
jgi:hypothetical protein